MDPGTELFESPVHDGRAHPFHEAGVPVQVVDGRQ